MHILCVTKTICIFPSNENASIRRYQILNIFFLFHIFIHYEFFQEFFANPFQFEMLQIDAVTIPIDEFFIFDRIT